jgi:hypothetical protein
VYEEVLVVTRQWFKGRANIRLRSSIKPASNHQASAFTRRVTVTGNRPTRLRERFVSNKAFVFNRRTFAATEPA